MLAVAGEEEEEEEKIQLLEEPEPEPEPEPQGEPEHLELYEWTDYALRFQLQTYKWPTPEGATGRVLADCYWESLVARELQLDETKRRWLACNELEHEEQARVWISSLIAIPLPEEGALQPLLSSGEALCDLINALRPGIIPKIARAPILEAMTENRRNARMRENIGQYVDACAELGVPQRELFITGDLFDNKDFKGVLKNIHGLARLTHYDLPDFQGPRIGIRKKNAQTSKETTKGGFFSIPSFRGVAMSSTASLASPRCQATMLGSPRVDPSTKDKAGEPAAKVAEDFKTTSL